MKIQQNPCDSSSLSLRVFWCVHDVQGFSYMLTTSRSPVRQNDNENNDNSKVFTSKIGFSRPLASDCINSW